MMELHRVMGMVKDIYNDVEGPRTSNSYHHRFRESDEENNITGAQLRALSRNEGPIDKKLHCKGGNCSQTFTIAGRELE